MNINDKIYVAGHKGLVGSEIESSSPTAIFFYEQTEDALLAALTVFEKTTFVREHLVSHAKNYDIPTFKQNFRDYIDSFPDSIVD